MLPYVDQFYLPKIDFYVEGRDCIFFKDTLVIEELKLWFVDKVNPTRLDMIVEAGMSITSKFAPNCTDQAKFIAMSKFVIFGYIFDDITPEPQLQGATRDEKKSDNKLQVFSKVAEVVGGHREPETSLEKVVHSIYAELKSVCLPGAYMRHVFGFTSWAETMQLEHSLQKSNAMDLEQFLEFRKDNGGFYGMTAILECMLDFDINDLWKICLPVYQDVYTHLMLVNDVYSFRKEYIQNDSTNILTFLMNNYKLSMQQAVYNVTELIDNLKERIKENVAKVLKAHKNAEYYPTLYNYFEALQTLTAGNLLHSQSISRYHGTTKCVRFGVLLMHPKDSILVKFNQPFLNNHQANFLLGFQIDPSLI